MSRVLDQGSPAPQPSAIAGEGVAAISKSVAVLRARDGRTESTTDRVAEETPVSIAYNGIAQLIVMATPAHLEDLAFGFTVTEGIATANEIRSVRVAEIDGGLQADVHIAAERFASLLQRQRNLTGRTGCGVCGVTTIEQAIRAPGRVTADVRIDAEELHATLRSLTKEQPLNCIVGSVHGAAWARRHEGIKITREDVGRHNALDKVIGALLRENIDPASGYLIITSRASYEMVLKAAIVGVPLLVAVSAPTGLAIDLAQQSGVTLIGFARERSHVVYTHPERILA